MNSIDVIIDTLLTENKDTKVYDNIESKLGLIQYKGKFYYKFNILEKKEILNNENVNITYIKLYNYTENISYFLINENKTFDIYDNILDNSPIYIILINTKINIMTTLDDIKAKYEEVQFEWSTDYMDDMNMVPLYDFDNDRVCIHLEYKEYTYIINNNTFKTNELWLKWITNKCGYINIANINDNNMLIIFNLLNNLNCNNDIYLEDNVINRSNIEIIYSYIFINHYSYYEKYGGIPISFDNKILLGDIILLYNDIIYNHKKQLNRLIVCSNSNREEYLDCIFRPTNSIEIDFSNKLKKLKQYYKKIIIPKYKYENIKVQTDLIKLLPKKYHDLTNTDITTMKIQSGGNNKNIKLDVNNFKFKKL